MGSLGIIFAYRAIRGRVPQSRTIVTANPLAEHAHRPVLEQFLDTAGGFARKLGPDDAAQVKVDGLHRVVKKTVMGTSSSPMHLSGSEGRLSN